jgi:hypothetical protein
MAADMDPNVLLLIDSHSTRHAPTPCMFGYSDHWHWQIHFGIWTRPDTADVTGTCPAAPHGTLSTSHLVLMSPTLQVFKGIRLAFYVTN